MAKFEEEKVINALHPEKAEVGQKYWYSDNILNLKDYVEENNVDFMGKLTELEVVDSYPFRLNDKYSWQFLYPYEEPPKQRMTNRQFIEWLAKGNGMFKYKNATPYCHIFVTPLESELKKEPAENTVIRTWDSEEWIEPTVDIYERDCKGGKK